jgi:hypothetical protein
MKEVQRRLTFAEICKTEATKQSPFTKFRAKLVEGDCFGDETSLH